jgi:hypothetical protein
MQEALINAIFFHISVPIFDYRGFYSRTASLLRSPIFSNARSILASLCILRSRNSVASCLLVLAAKRLGIYISPTYFPISYLHLYEPSRFGPSWWYERMGIGVVLLCGLAIQTAARPRTAKTAICGENIYRFKL